MRWWRFPGVGEETTVGLFGQLPGFGSPEQLAHIPSKIVEVADGQAVAGVNQQLGKALDDGRGGEIEPGGLGDFG